VETRLKNIERQMFTGEPRSTVRAISNINREFLHLEAALATQAEPLAQFLEELTKRNLFPATFQKRTKHLEAEHAQVSRMLNLMRAVATELRETNTDLLNTQQNEIMKVLTIMAFVTFPLSLISSIFGMNTHYLPIVGQPGDFWIILGLMVALASSFLIFFRMKHWL